MSIFVTQIKGSAALSRTDINKVSETVLIPLFAEVYGFSNLRNLNSTERANFPAIDLADDVAKVAIQITSRKDLGKVKDTLLKFKKHELYRKYDRLFIYVLTEKQRSYDRNSCKEIVQDKFDFDPDKNILDYRDVLREIDGFQIEKTRRIQEVLEANFGESRVLTNLSNYSRFPTDLVDNSIKTEIEKLRKSRFLIGFDENDYALRIARKLSEGDLYGGTDSVKAWALMWCARILSTEESLTNAEDFLEIAKSLGADTRIVDALICSRKGNKQAALVALASINSPESLTAALFVVAHHDGPKASLEWLSAAGKSPSDLDPDGKYVLLATQLQQGKWEEATETTHALTESDLNDVPTLHYMVAMTYILSTVPEGRREIVLNHVPFDAVTFPLASDVTAIDARRTARSHFINAAKAVRELNYPGIASIPDGYALWLELRDPEYFDKGKRRLERRLRDSESALHFVPLGLQYGVGLDVVAAEREVERHIVLHGGMTRDAAAARLALARSQETPEDVANYVNRHYAGLSEYFDTKALRSMQIEMLSRAGRIERAYECLEFLIEEGVSGEEESRLRTIIKKNEGRDIVRDRKALFEKTGSFDDLTALISDLEQKGDWETLCKYRETLFKETRDVQDAEGLANALHNSNRFSRVIEVIEENSDLLEQSPNLRLFYCWALYFEGALLCAHSEFAKLSANQIDADLRALQVNIAIALGQWDSLFGYVANEFKEKENRSALDLIKAARLALYLDSSYAKQLSLAAADKDNNDAEVLAAAYSLAVKAGWESEPQFIQCLRRAVELSESDGPLRKIALKDFLDMKPEWDRRDWDTWQLLKRGEIPMILLAESFGKSIVNMMPSLAYRNLSEDDLRRKGGIPTYSGRHQPGQLDFRMKIGIDYTTLLTLSFLNILKTALGAFDLVHVPHPTLAWLFEEKENATFHQPSRIRDAHHVLHLISSKKLEIFSPSATADSELSAQVGEDLALLIAEAKNITDEYQQGLVVRPSPVYRIASLLEEEADLTQHFPLLSSCYAVVRELCSRRAITLGEEQVALSYLQLHERPWSHQPEITDNAILYLDDLAVYYFLHLGILEKLSAAGFRAIVSQRLVAEVNELIAYERNSGKVVDLLENIRTVVSQGIQSGLISVGKWHSVDASWTGLSDIQMAGVLAMEHDCDAIVADDRFLNQHGHMIRNDVKTPLFTSLDLLDALVSAGSITAEDRLEYRTKLRRAGYFFVPLREDELTQFLDSATLADGKLNETTELKAIRENILLVRMDDWLQLPQEDIWLDSVVKAFVGTLRNLWSPDADIPSVRARSDWILDQLDIRGWAHSFKDEARISLARTGNIGIILLLITPLHDVPPDILDAYWSWVEDRILGPVKEQDSDLYFWIVDLKQKQILESVDSSLTEE